MNRSLYLSAGLLLLSALTLQAPALRGQDDSGLQPTQPQDPHPDRPHAAQTQAPEPGRPKPGQTAGAPGDEPQQAQPSPERHPAAPGQATPPTPPAGEIPALGSQFRLDRWVFDTTGTLKPAEISRIQDRVERFTAETGSPLMVVLLRHWTETGSDGADAIAAAQKLMAQLESKFKNGPRGWMILFCTEQRWVWIQRGSAWGPEVDAPAVDIVNERMKPLLSSKGPEGQARERDFPGAILAGIQGLTHLLYRSQQAEQPLLTAAAGQFMRRGWLWILLGMHLLGMLYVLCTKESGGWYLAGILLGLPILLAMLIFVVEGEEGAARAAGRDPLWLEGAPGGTKDALRACEWGFW